MSDLDKDIEILKEFKEKGFASLMIKYNKDRIQTNTMVERALENVLSKLEIYKKIAEFLTDYIDEIDESETVCNNKAECDLDCKKCIIDWARKEVEKDE